MLDSCLAKHPLRSSIVKESLSIAGDICIYTNQQHTIETLGAQ